MSSVHNTEKTQTREREIEEIIRGRGDRTLSQRSRFVLERETHFSSLSPRRESMSVCWLEVTFGWLFPGCLL